MAKKKTTYQDALQEIEEIVEEIENGTIGIDQLSIKVKRALELLSHCKQTLTNTEDDISKTMSDLEP